MKWILLGIGGFVLYEWYVNNSTLPVVTAQGSSVATTAIQNQVTNPVQGATSSLIVNRPVSTRYQTMGSSLVLDANAMARGRGR